MSQVTTTLTASDNVGPLAEDQAVSVSASALPGTGADLRRFALAAGTLWQREMVRFFRQPNRVVSSIVSPLMLWVMLGFGLDQTVTLPVTGEAGAAAQEIGYLLYFFPGIITMTVLFTAIFSTITVIEDRREGFLQGVMVAPVPRLAIAMGKVLGGATIACVHGFILLLLWPTVGPWPGIAAMGLAAISVVVISVSLTALGLCIAWRMDSTAGFHAIMMMGLMPMWFLSGAVFPLDQAPAAMQAIMWVNPLTYGHAALVDLLLGQPVGAPVSWPVGLSVSAIVAIGFLWLAGVCVAQRRKDGSG